MSMRRWRGSATPRSAPEAAELIELGINHEQQHQELLLTDILSLFAAEPLKPAYREADPGVGAARAAPLGWVVLRRRHLRQSAMTATASPTTMKAPATSS